LGEDRAVENFKLRPEKMKDGGEKRLSGSGGDKAGGRGFSKNDYHNILLKLQPQEPTKSQTLEDINKILTGPSQFSNLQFDHSRRPALPNQHVKPFSEEALNTHIKPSILNNPRLVTSPIKPKIDTIKSFEQTQPLKNHGTDQVDKGRSYGDIYKQKKLSGRDSHRSNRSRASSRRSSDAGRTHKVVAQSNNDPYQAENEQIEAQLGNRIRNLLVKDFSSLLNIYLDQRLSNVEELEQLEPTSLKFELSELILKKVEILMDAVEEGSLSKWLSSLAASRSNVSEKERFTKIKRLFERTKFIAGGSEDSTVNRSDLRHLNTLLLEVSLIFPLYSA
jgi:hypothetical protein